jgi:hypothetical protein
MTDFGSDLGGVDDVDPTFQLVSGRTTLIQSVARRYITDRGTVAGDEENGLNLRDWLNESVTPAELATLTREVEDEALKDERVQSCSAIVVFTASRNAVTITLRLVEKVTGAAFTLTVTITDLTLEILEAA